MKKIVAFNGSPRPAGNSGHMLSSFLNGAEAQGTEAVLYRSHELNIRGCTGCLRCNVLKRCSLTGDDWKVVSSQILEADILVIASPIYFHHLPASLKLILDRFRSFAEVQITESRLVHTPHQAWKKDFVLLLSQGSPDPVDARPVIELFEYICRIMGNENRLHVLTGTRLAMVNHVVKDEEGLRLLYRKLQLPEKLAGPDARSNRELLKRCGQLGKKLARSG
jgi:NAD(P)H-dependent FMN reductase